MHLATCAGLEKCTIDQMFPFITSLLNMLRFRAYPVLSCRKMAFLLTVLRAPTPLYLLGSLDANRAKPSISKIRKEAFELTC